MKEINGAVDTYYDNGKLASRENFLPSFNA